VTLERIAKPWLEKADERERARESGDAREALSKDIIGIEGEGKEGVEEEGEDAGVGVGVDDDGDDGDNGDGDDVGIMTSVGRTKRNMNAKNITWTA
jgi:hypothetical protein